MAKMKAIEAAVRVLEKKVLALHSAFPVPPSIRCMQR